MQSLIILLFLIKIIFKKDKYLLNKREKELLKYLIAKGVPNHFRQNLWILCSGAKNDLLNNASYYNNLLKLSKEVPSLYEKQIDKDIKRTINDNSKNYDDLKQQMKNIFEPRILNATWENEGMQVSLKK